MARVGIECFKGLLWMALGIMAVHEIRVRALEARAVEATIEAGLLYEQGRCVEAFPTALRIVL